MAIRPDLANTPLITATGAVVIWWGRIEGLLFQELSWYRHHPAVRDTGICKPLYIASEKMIAQWARAARRIVAASPNVQAEISAIKGELAECSETRHIMVHGFWPYPSPDDDPNCSVVSVVKPNREGGILIAQYEVDYQTVTDFHDRLVRLYHRILHLTLHGDLRAPNIHPTAKPSEATATPPADGAHSPARNRKRTLGLRRTLE